MREVLTNERLEQGISYLKEQELDIEPKNLGTFLKWIANDIQTEESDIFESRQVTWKTFAKHLNQEARNYFFKRMD